MEMKIKCFERKRIPMPKLNYFHSIFENDLYFFLLEILFMVVIKCEAIFNFFNHG